MQRSGLYAAADLAPLVAIADDGSLIETLAKVMQGWSVVDAERAGGAPEPVPAIRVRQGPGGWTFLDAAGATEVTFGDPVAAACKIIADLYKAQTLIDRAGLCLHAAGVRSGGGLVLLTGHYRAGKSVVTAACAAAGLQVFSDDIIPLAPGARVARAPGLAIRLRLPLPKTLSPATRAFVTRHQVATGPRYVYIRPPASRLAAKGEEAPIGAIVSLRRAAGAPARLLRLDPGEALSELIRRNFAREAPARRILDTFDRLVDGIPAYTLEYDRADEAAALLASQGELTAAAGAVEGPGSAAPQAEKPGRAKAPLPDAALVSRQPSARVRERDGQAFLTDAADLVILNLNATGAAVWRALERPVTFGDLVDLFAAAFPERDRAALAADLSHLVEVLSRNDLVRLQVAAHEGRGVAADARPGQAPAARCGKAGR